MWDNNTTGAIWNKHPILDNPKYAKILADFLDKTYKPYINDITEVFVNNDTGSDDNDGLSSVTAFETLERAFQKCQGMYGDQTVIQVANTGIAYSLGGISNLNNVLVNGEDLDEETRNVTSVIDFGVSVGCIFEVDGPTLADDEWANRILHLRGAGNNVWNINVDSNVGNTIYGCTVNRNFINDNTINPTGGTVTLLSLPEINVPDITVFAGSTDFRFNLIRFTGNQVFINQGGKFEWLRCEVKNQAITSGLGGGVAFILSSVVAMTGANDGFLLGRRGGVLQIGSGSVVNSSNLNNPANNFIDIAQDSQLVFVRGLILRDCKFRMDGANSFILPQPNLRFVMRELGGTPTVDTPYIINSQVTGLGYSYFLPDTRGEISGDYMVEASRGAVVELRAGTNVTTLLGTNTVSADNGNSLSARDIDNTTINGGSPELSAMWNVVVEIDADTTLTASQAIIHTDTSGGDVILTLDPAELQNGAEYTIKNFGSNDVIIVATGGQINGSASAIVAPNTGVQIYLYNNDWFIK